MAENDNDKEKTRRQTERDALKEQIRELERRLEKLEAEEKSRALSKNGKLEKK